jgi:CheY-like chemotaxis protein
LKKLNKILLVDDEEASNFLNQIVIRQSKVAGEVVAYEKAKDALDYITEQQKQGDSPDLVFLDINMPIMNGWDFMDEYAKIAPDANTKIIMLTSSINPNDKERASKIGQITGFRSKPLTVEMLDEIVSNHF